MANEICSRCGAAIEGGAEGCNALFADLNGLDYTNVMYAAAHQLTVDAHCLQHPEDHGIKNNAFHLVSLCFQLEFGGGSGFGSHPRWLVEPFNGMPPDLPALEPPPPTQRGAITIVDVMNVPPEEHRAMARQWAESVWAAWSAYHDWARGFITARQP